MTTEEIICKHCGLVDDYYTVQAGPHLKAICNGCDRYIKFVKQGNEPMMYFGKYKGREIKTLVSKDEIQYLYWVLGNLPNLSNTNIENITNHLKKYPRKQNQQP